MRHITVSSALQVDATMHNYFLYLMDSHSVDWEDLYHDCDLFESFLE